MFILFLFINCPHKGHKLFWTYSTYHNKKQVLKGPDIVIKKEYCIPTKYMIHY